jgi:uncharacterized protein (TIGR00661 family)
VSDKINIKILVAPLDWGLGHATRCIPIITQLLQLGCKVIIATEGAQEKLLKTEFPNLVFVRLRGYQIRYSANKRFFPLKIILQLPKIFRAIKMENRWLRAFIRQTPVDAVISDNRYGLYHAGVPCVFITHQLLIKAPFSVAEKLMQRLNYSLIEKFSKCWVPDYPGLVNLAGLLSHPAKFPAVKVEYLGGLSRLNKTIDCKKEFDLLVILSGPEPQRSLLEKKLTSELRSFEGTVLLVRGLPANNEITTSEKNIIVRNHLPARELEEAVCKSELVISRSGYTTVMDICKLQKKAVLIPTPGQTEQEYLAYHLEKQGWCIAMQQDDFSLPKLLERVKHFEYKLPQLDMDAYKDVVTQFVRDLKS